MSNKIYERLTGRSKEGINFYLCTCLKALKVYNLSSLNVPDYNEFSVKVMYNALKNNETAKLFMPDYPNGQLPDKEFFMKLI